MVDLRRNDKRPPSPETLRLVRALLFPPYPPPPDTTTLCLILGSRNCEYRARRAFAFFAGKNVHYITAGGGRTPSGETEAAYMHARLIDWGVPPDRVRCDYASLHTVENLRNALPLIETLSTPDQPVHLALVTAGFHLARTLQLARIAFARMSALHVFPLPAYGPNTAPDSWHLNPIGRTVIADELEKLCNRGLLPETRLD